MRSLSVQEHIGCWYSIAYDLRGVEIKGDEGLFDLNFMADV